MGENHPLSIDIEYTLSIGSLKSFNQLYEFTILSTLNYASAEYFGIHQFRDLYLCCHINSTHLQFFSPFKVKALSHID